MIDFSHRRFFRAVGLIGIAPIVLGAGVIMPIKPPQPRRLKFPHKVIIRTAIPFPAWRQLSMGIR